MTVFYLDVDDEITSAVARLKSSTDYRVGLALPAGSRVATSRMNFRLLAREARAHQRRLAIISPESSVRAIAVASGLPSYASVQAYEDAIEAERDQHATEEPAAIAGAGAAVVAGAAVPEDAEALAGPAVALAGPAVAHAGPEGAGDGVVGAATAAAPGAAAVPTSSAMATGAGVDETAATAGQGAVGPQATTPAELAAVVPGVGEPPTRASTDAPTRAATLHGRSAGALPVVKTERRRGARAGGSRWLVVGAVSLLVVVAVAAGLALVVLPAAEIVVTPSSERAGPVTVQVTADPAAASVDSANLVVPALQVPIPLTASGSFPATGVKVDQKPATGSVTFASNNPIDPVTVPAGTTLATQSGVQFQTTATVTIPKATIQGTTITAGRASAPVQAVSPGPQGNVPANTIVVVPARLQAFLVASTNPAPTTGGTRTQTKIVSQTDYDAAVKALSANLEANLASAAAAPPNLPAGTTAFPATARHDQPIASPTAGVLVGQPMASFDLSMAANGTVTAVDEQEVKSLAEARLASTVPSGYQLFPEATTTTLGDASMQGQKVVLPVTATGEQWRPVTPAELLPLVRGKSIADATSALSPYGSVVIHAWPGYVTQVPPLDGRITITVAPPRRVSS